MIKRLFSQYFFFLIFDIGMQLVNVDFRKVYNGVIGNHYKLRLIKMITI